ncbi:Receptor-type tyrosine-protein phosphatase alpha [Holothuria leucospilota]|uniref:protein-tyrosine-phosphatase n=1 Tax=Holothuria leucospilota TaxID=206669 RepID=A0A9Q1CA53_HOLLE|nr:Receptor-type tyrosine-protein phosphatase alpha [Holothuria leucospilota]
MTLLGLKPFRSEVDSNYQCYTKPRRLESGGASLESFRTGWTRDTASDNPPPPSPVYQHANTFRHYKIPLTNNYNNNGFGVFGCRINRSGQLQNVNISTVRMRSNAYITPGNELVTQTVNIGDKGINITMNIQSTSNGQDLTWRHNNDTIAEMQRTSNTTTFSIGGPIQLNHSGIYECHVDGERHLARHGLNLLLVRACPTGRWGPPNCTGVCDSCYNGGICDEYNGTCVCPPGFMGDNCLTACGGNRYGHTCEIKCSSDDSAEKCEGHQFCLVHPYGCRCNTGWKGLACNKGCDQNSFGASCLQSCHCVSNRCDRYRGTCTGSNTRCKTGWTGDNCQECVGNFFGTNCSLECHCKKDKCNIETGLCKPGGCLPQWVDLYPPYSCQTGLQNITYPTLKVNRGASAKVICTAVKGLEGDLTNLDLVLSREEDNLQHSNITIGKSEEDGSTKLRYFTVANVQRGDMFYCQLRDRNGSKLAVLGHNDFFDVYDLPELKNPPTNLSIGSSSVIIKWLAWDNTKDTGDPPVVGYLPYYKRTEEDDWLPGSKLSSETLMYTFNRLDPDTNYSFSVAAIRDGDGGEGPKSPQLNVSTICKVPPSPENLKTETENNLVKISWQIPPSNDLGCNSGIIKFTISYFSSGTEIASLDVIDPAATMFILHNLTDTVSYTFYMTLTTAGGESDKSDEVQHNGHSAGELQKDSPGLVIAVSLFSVLFVVMLVALVVILLLKRRRMDSSPHTTTVLYEKPGPQNSAYRPTSGMPAPFPEEDVEGEDEEEEQDDDQVLYTNIEKPVSILIAGLEKHLRDCESSKTSNLEQQFLLLNGGKQFDNLVGTKEENKAKNRFKNMIAYDHSRVVLPLIDGNPYSDYYNANYIKNLDGEIAFIASQGPNKASVDDFWRMVLMADVHHIVMLTNLIEGGKNRCIQYWPLAAGKTKRFSKIDVKFEKEEQFADYDIRELNVEMGEQSHKVTNWHFKTWPDKNIPDQPPPLIEFTNKVKSLQETCSGPLLVHCSAGVGRTGTFIALYSLTDAMKHSDRIDVYGFVEQMRQNRIRMVQTGLQYKFLHECLLEVFLTGDTKIPLDTMERIDFGAERDKLNEQFKMLAKLDQRSAKPHSFCKEEYKKSRYPTIFPVDKKRPFLQSPGKASSSSYINACIVPSYKKKNAFIATQSPLPNTVEDFWRLVYDWNCPLIVMLNQLDPRDKTCCKYWPESGSSQFGHMTVKLKDQQNTKFYSTFRQFDITHSYDQKARSVFQLQLKSWDTRKLRDIISLIKDMEKLQQNCSMVTPIIVHCINGVGRTGVLIAVKSEMERFSAEGNFDVFTTVRKLRGSNLSMVYTEEDYYICHQLLKLEFPESQYANM